MGETVRLIEVVCVRIAALPPTPVTVTVAGPIAAELVAVKVRMLSPVAGSGLKKAVTPLGRVEVTDKFTLPVNLLVEFTVMVVVLLLP
jgi:hypothetical protein